MTEHEVHLEAYCCRSRDAKAIESPSGRFSDIVLVDLTENANLTKVIIDEGWADFRDEPMSLLEIGETEETWDHLDASMSPVSMDDSTEDVPNADTPFSVDEIFAILHGQASEELCRKVQALQALEEKPQKAAVPAASVIQPKKTPTTKIDVSTLALRSLSKAPNVRWKQTKEIIVLTISASDDVKYNIKVTTDDLYFT